MKFLGKCKRLRFHKNQTEYKLIVICFEKNNQNDALIVFTIVNVKWPILERVSPVVKM